MIFIWIDKVHVVNNSPKIIWIFTIANSRNVDLTEKQHSRHQQFLRIPLSPLGASSRLPRSRDHLFSHSMSKASLPQGPDMWYLTFYENKVPIYQTTISNSFYFKISLATFVRNCGAKPKDERTTAPFQIGIGISVPTRTMQILEDEYYLYAFFCSGNVCSFLTMHILVI